MTHRHLPTIDEVGVVCCGECGEPLELRCVNGHDPLPIGVRAEFSLDIEGDVEGVEPDAAPLPPDRQRRAPARPPVFEPKQCACGETFTPSGPNAKRCPTCRGPRA